MPYKTKHKIMHFTRGKVVSMYTYNVGLERVYQGELKT